MQYPHPLHTSGCTTTVPNSVRNSAPVGHTSRQAAWVQCLQTSEDISHRTPASASEASPGPIVGMPRSVVSTRSTDGAASIDGAAPADGAARASSRLDVAGPDLVLDVHVGLHLHVDEVVLRVALGDAVATPVVGQADLLHPLVSQPERTHALGHQHPHLDRGPGGHHSGP